MRRMIFNSLRTILSCAILLLLTMTAHAQFKASVEGTVTDQNGAVVTGATVTLTSDETGRTLQTTTSNDGFYRFSSLAPGHYTITADKTSAGFNKVTIPGIVVNAEGTQGVNITLTAGVTASVTVTADNATALQTENPNITRAIGTEEVRELPQVGRDPYELLRLTPGVFGSGARGGSGGAVNLPNTTGPGGSNNSIFQTENQVPISANGQRVSDNNFQIDGVSVNSFNWGGAALVTPNQESVKEIRVKSSSYSAEDGRNSGAQIEVVSQNGTNDFHGSAFIKYDSPKLNAYNKYGGLGGAPPVRVQNYIRQFGGSLGGPLPFPRFGEGGPSTFWGKNRSFFFFSYEGLSNNTTNFGTAYVETPQFRQLVVQQRPGSIAAQIFSASGIAPRTLNVLTPSCTTFTNAGIHCQVVNGGVDIGSLAANRGQYTTLAGGPLDGIPDLQLIQFYAPNQNRGNQYNARFDFTPNERDTLTFSTYITRLNDLSSDPSAQARPIADLPLKPLNTSGTITYNRVLSPTAVNEARFNGTRFFYNQFQDAINTNFGIPRIEIQDLPLFFNDRVRYGAPWGSGTPAKFAENIFEFSDTLNKVFGNHGAKFGFVYRNEQDNSNLSGTSRPLYTFSGLFNFANDTPIFEQIEADPRTGLPADLQRYFRDKYYAGFVQDDWKFRPNLTINLGLRYEYFSPLTEKQGRLSNIIFSTPGTFTGATVRPVDQLYNPDRNNFAPRLGFAYSPTPESFGGLFGHFFKANSAVIRGGFGIAYDRIPVAPLGNTRNNPPFAANYGLCCGTTGSPFAGGTILYALGSSNSPISYPPNPALNPGINPATGAPNGLFVEIYGAPQKLPNPYVYLYSLELEYSLAYSLTATIGYQGSTGHKFDRLVNQNFLYPNSPYSAVYILTPDTNSNFNALLVELSRRFARGFQFQLNYRWSKSIDENSYEGPGFVTNQTYPQDNRTERGPSDYDVRHYLTVSSIYELPFYKGRSDFAGRALGGFLLSGILTYHTGFPWTPVVGGCTSTPGGPLLCPVRPQGYTGPAHPDTSNQAFITGSDFPGGGAPYFIVYKQANGTIAPPGIGRNSFRGPKYFDVDMSLVKQIRLGGFLHLGEGANLELRANAYNIFNKLNLAPFGFSSTSTTIGNFNPGPTGSPGTLTNNPNFGRATAGLAGRVVELQARFQF